MNKISKRNIALSIVLTIITGGVYAYYWQYKLIENTRVVQGTRGSCVGEFLCFMFVPFYALYWWFTRGNSVEQILSKQGYHTSGSGILYLILSFFGLQMVSMAIAQYDFNGLPDSVVFKPGANTIHKTGLGAKASRIISNTIIYILLVSMTLIWLFPSFGLVMESFFSFSSSSRAYKNSVRGNSNNMTIQRLFMHINTQVILHYRFYIRVDD